MESDKFNDVVSRCKFIKVPIGGQTIFKPSFGAKIGETTFYQLVLDGEPVSEIEINPISKNGKPEIMSLYSTIKKRGLGEYLVGKILDIYLKDEVFVRATSRSKRFWKKVGAKVVDPSDLYFMYFTKTI